MNDGLWIIVSILLGSAGVIGGYFLRVKQHEKEYPN